MTATTATLLGSGRASRWSLRRARSALASTWMVISFAVAAIPLAMVIGYVISKGAQVISWGFLTSPLPIIDQLPQTSRYGMGPAVVGTLIITGAATAMAVPLGVLGGIYLNEYAAKGKLGRLIRFMAEVMTSVPSIVMGLFVYIIWVLQFGFSAFAGALALGCLMLPIVIRSTEEILRLVPNEQREASYALSARKARTIFRVVLPTAAPGILSGALLAVARAAGETAPLLFTILVVTSTNTSLLHGPNTALSTQIFKGANSVFAGSTERAWGAALTLIAIVFIFTLLARIVTAIFSRRQQV